MTQFKFPKRSVYEQMGVTKEELAEIDAKIDCSMDEEFSQQGPYRVCLDCEVSLWSYAPKCKRCVTCQKRHKYRLKREAEERRLLEIDKPRECLGCGCSLEGTYRARKRCPPCASRHNRKMMRANYRRKNWANHEERS